VTTFVQTVIAGLGNGAIYALMAVGFVIIYKSTHVLNFAHPAIMAAGATVVAFLSVVYGLNFYLSVLLAVSLIALLALLLERLALRPMVGKPVFIVAIITLGLDVAIRAVTNRFIGPDLRPIGEPWGFASVDVGGVLIQHRYLAMLLTTAVVLGVLFAFFKYSRIGLAMRAAALDQETALAQGVSVGLVFALSWAIGGGLATLAGTFAATGTGVSQGTWVIGLKALPAIIVGGLDSTEGAVVGGLAVGVFEALFATYQSAYAPWLGANFSLVSPYVLMLLVLLVRPYGLFGTPEVRRV
jgi:branched-chain amino acid transport system permease protein